MDEDKIELAQALYDSGKYDVKEITERTWISKAKLYQALQERKK